MIMRKRISRCCLSLICSVLLLLCGMPLLAQSKADIEEVRPEEPLYKGTSVYVDLFGIGSKLLGGDFFSTEIGVEVNLKQKYFPVVELGYGTTDATEDTYNMHYKSASPYARIGLNYNMMSKSGKDSYLYLGLRYGFAPLKYDVSGPPMDDDIWTGDKIPFEYKGEKSTAHWGEFLVGIKAQVYKNLLMGWTFRYKARIHVKDNPNTTPWYIPGFGSNTSTKFGFTYSIIYQLPF